VVTTGLWWLASAAAVPLLAAPWLVVVRRSTGRRVRFLERRSAPDPWWAQLLGLVGVVLGTAAVEGLSDSREDVLLHGGGLLVASLVLGACLTVRHNRRVAAEPDDARAGAAGTQDTRRRPAS
jgi:hypothetical protein